MRVCVEFTWRDVGVLNLDSGRLRFPDVQDVPGVYRFDLGERAYIGESDRLRRRFQHYRTPGPTQATNLRLNALMLDLLSGGGPISLFTITDARVNVDGEAKALDLRDKPARLLLENAALTAARLAGHAVENL